jgi:hypothetical protein
MMYWLRLLVAWYVLECDKKEGCRKRVFSIPSREFRLCGSNWRGKHIRVTVETVNDFEEDGLWVMTYSKRV